MPETIQISLTGTDRDYLFINQDGLQIHSPVAGICIIDSTCSKELRLSMPQVRYKDSNPAPVK